VDVLAALSTEESIKGFSRAGIKGQGRGSHKKRLFSLPQPYHPYSNKRKSLQIFSNEKVIGSSYFLSSSPQDGRERRKSRDGGSDPIEFCQAELPWVLSAEIGNCKNVLQNGRDELKSK